MGFYVAAGEPTGRGAHRQTVIQRVGTGCHVAGSTDFFLVPVLIRLLGNGFRALASKMPTNRPREPSITLPQPEAFNRIMLAAEMSTDSSYLLTWSNSQRHHRPL
jgi:hypothetical protein